MSQKPFVAALVIPTGVGASIGGFAGDATPVMNQLAQTCDVLITHPNVANAAIFQNLPHNALYVEGYGLDQFFKGHWGLMPVQQNRLGVILDCGIEPRMKLYHHNVIRAMQAVYGIVIIDILETDEPVHISYNVNDSGCSGGTVGNPDTLLQAAKRLQANGAEAIAMCVHFPEYDNPDANLAYHQGNGVDPVGGIEAVLSHLIVSALQIPCAHSPVFSEASYDDTVFTQLLAPRVAAEYLAPTFLPCVVNGLMKAPQFSDLQRQTPPTLPLPHKEEGDFRVFTVHDVNALIVPVNALGSIPVLSALSRNIPVIAVQENTTVCAVDASQFPETSNLILADTYSRASSLLANLKAIF